MGLDIYVVGLKRTKLYIVHKNSLYSCNMLLLKMRNIARRTAGQQNRSLYLVLMGLAQTLYNSKPLKSICCQKWTEMKQGTKPIELPTRLQECCNPSTQSHNSQMQPFQNATRMSWQPKKQKVSQLC